MALRVDGAAGAGTIAPVLERVAEPVFARTAPAEEAFVLEPEDCENASRWWPGMRLQHLLSECLTRRGDEPAVDEGTGVVTCAELDTRANRLARHLIAKSVRPGARVAILLDNGTDSYVAMLAVLKAGAAFVPLDAGFPDDRIAFILEDAGASMALTTAARLSRFPAGFASVALDAEAGAIGAQSGDAPAEAPGDADALCYVIYTSGTTGRPKGVQIDHSSICNFVAVAAETYGIRPGARMYQGLTVAFDFSVEEIWVPLLSGATLVPAPAGGKLVGDDLQRFLAEQRVTAMCVVPTLLATLDRDLPQLDFLLVSGEACPQDLASRWSRPGRRFLNAYGPTETTVTATLGQIEPGRAITIGRPLPTYKIVILDPEAPVALPRGATGEIVIAGPGLSRGYLNREEATRRAFVPDFLDLPGNPTGKLYRTGDLGRVNDDGEVEYAGRIDTQVKIRGYRIELTEIESVILAVPGVAQAVVDTWNPMPEVTELVAYYTVGATPATPADIHAALRQHLPAYMVPAFYERLDLIPMLPSDKADRKRLPPPKGARFSASSAAFEAPRDEDEVAIAGLVAEALGGGEVSVIAQLFDDLGMNSLTAARMAARIRAMRPATRLSMRDIYLNPTVRALGAFLADESVATGQASAPEPLRASVMAYWAMGAGQALAYFATLWLYAYVAISLIDWADAAPDWPQVVFRAVASSIAGAAFWCALPVAAKWLLVGRFRPQRFAIWSFAHFRFWIVKSMMRASPMALFVGTPILPFYLRLLGARIGRNVLILTTHFPAAPDLIEIGDETVIRKDVFMSCYRAEAGGIELGPIRLGRRCLVGEASLLDIDTRMEDGSELAHASSLHRGQAIAAGEQWHGSPGQRRTTPVPRAVSGFRPSTLRALVFSAFHVATPLLVATPALICALVWLHRLSPSEAFHPLEALPHPVPTSLALYGALLALGLLGAAVLPRLAWLTMRSGREYRLHGFRHEMLLVIARWSNSRTFNLIFGDSSYILHYLKLIGWRVSLRGQTGSNFGLDQRHDVPFVTTAGDSSLASDGLSFANTEFTAGGFRVLETSIGERNFLGNAILFPAGARTGDDCLLATRVMVPVDGPVRQGVGLLGSPAFEIPRSVRRDEAFDWLKEPGVLAERLARKNRSNLASMGLYLLTRWLLFLFLLVTIETSFDYHGVYGAVALAAALFVVTLVTAAYYVLIERLTLGFRRMEPKFCSIYDPYYWRHERYWKLNDADFIRLFDGTPFKGLIWRALGVRWGRMNFDDGCSITERTLVEVGDRNTIGEHAVLQSHSLENGVFKSDHVRVGSGVTIGTRGYVSYGTVIGDGASIGPDSFLMKGETMPADAAWRGNPARMQ
jgi:non-ribosomal peptide synthetase-like protein